MISKKSVDEIFDSITVATFARIINTELKKSGRNHVCLSPFANEKTPSCFIFNGGTRYKDFSSGEGGTAIDLVMKLENKTYPEALERIAEINNLQVEYEETETKNPEKVERLEEMSITLRAAIRAYDRKLHDLPKDHPVWEDQLLGKRQLDMHTIQEWGLGYAPDDWTWMWDKIRESGKYTPALALGLVQTKGDRTFDTLRNAVIFPIHNDRGQLVSHAGRLLSTEPYKGKMPPKYINGPSSDLYDKSAILYGLHIAKKRVRLWKEVNLVEGYFDVINMHRAGAENTVATCGTALTEKHCELLKRQGVRWVNVMRDNDEAGQKAAMRDFELLLGYGFEVRVVQLPDGMDPDDFSCTQIPAGERYEREEMKI